MSVPEIVEPHKFNHSFSALNTFLNTCELRYAHDKLTPFTGNEHTRRGHAVHEAMEAWALLGFHEHHVAELAKRFSTDEISADGMRIWLERVFPVARDLHAASTDDVEFWIRMPLKGCTQKLVGKVDLLSSRGPDQVEEPCIVDWKSVLTMEKMLTQSECDKSLQGRIYSWATGVRRVAFVYWTPFHDARWVLSEYTEKQIAQTAAFVEHNCRVIEHRWKQGGWRKTAPGGLCAPKWCSRYSHCWRDDA